MASDLQRLVDQLSARVGAPAVLEDHEQRTVVHASQAGPIDHLRRESILHRATPPELIEWYRSFGIYDSSEPLRIPAQSDKDILARVCAPVRYRDRLLGFLWLIDADGSIGAEELHVIAQAAEHAALLLFEDRLAQRLLVQALNHLLSPSAELREAAATQLFDQSLVHPGEPTAAVVVTPLLDGDVPAGVVEEALADVGWEVPSGAFINLARDDHGVLLVRLRSGEGDRAAVSLATSVQRALAHRLEAAGDPAPRVVATIGDVQDDLDRFATSYRQARLAARVARAIPGAGDVVRWCDLGVFRALTQLPNREAVGSAIDPRVMALLACGDDDLVATVEAYLDLACDAKNTALHLHLHRGTLYYRLEKAERLTGVDMHNGYDRLAVHLGVKLARLEGVWNGGPPAAGVPAFPGSARQL